MITKVRRMAAGTRFAYARQFEGLNVEVITSFYGDVTTWHGRVVAVAAVVSGADVIVIKLTGTHSHQAVSLATVDTIREI